jgi:uncharacterized membrane protein YbjE (DUF340 family)
MAEAIYVLCAVTSLACAGLLFRAWAASRMRLLLWCLVCFVGLALNNALLLVDKVIVDGTDLSAWRALPAALGVGALVYGLIWDARTR